MKLLIAYCTKTGTTRDIAAEIARVLTAKGVVVESRALSEAEDLTDWDAVVIGGPINGMKWVAEAEAFVARHAQELKGKKTALFLVSYMVRCGRPMWRRAIAKALDTSATAIGPVCTGMFEGKLESPLPAPARWIFGVPRTSPLDRRDWPAIVAWAEELAERLRPQLF